MPKEYLSFDQLVEERRRKRFDERSPARTAEAYQQIDARLEELPSDSGEFIAELLEQRKEPHAYELIVSWTRGVDMLEDAVDMLLERFYEQSIVAACTAVEVILAGLLKHHIRVTHFAKNRNLGDEIVGQLLRNGVRDQVPLLFREAFGIDLKSRAEWKDWTLVYQWRNKVVHHATEISLAGAFVAVFSSIQLTEFINAQIEAKAAPGSRLSSIWAFLFTDTSVTLSKLDEALRAVHDHIELTGVQ